MQRCGVWLADLLLKQTQGFPQRWIGKVDRAGALRAGTMLMKLIFETLSGGNQTTPRK